LTVGFANNSFSTSVALSQATLPLATPGAPNNLNPATGKLEIVETRLDPAGLSMTFTSSAGMTYFLEAADQLQGAHWRVIGPLATASSNRTTVRDTQPPRSGMRFYRVVQTTGSSSPGNR